jgi:hypothetical protein
VCENFNLPQLTPQFGGIVVETTTDIHIFSLLDIFAAQNHCEYFTSLII